MSTTGAPSGPQQVPGWVMSANEVIERFYLLIRVNLLWLVLTLLGLIVLGLAPATAAAADALLEARFKRKLRVLPLMWSSYRSQLVRANTQLLPLMAVQAGALAILQISLSGAIASPAAMVTLTVVAGVSMAWASASLAAILSAARLRRQDLAVVWRIALLAPGALPLRSIALIVLVALWTLLCVLIAPLSLLVGAAGALDLATGLFGRRIEELLEQIDQAKHSHS